MSVELEKPVKLACVSSVITDSVNKKLFGEIMTIVDASYSDQQAKRAIKSLISQSFTRVSKNILEELNNIPKEG